MENTEWVARFIRRRSPTIPEVTTNEEHVALYCVDPRLEQDTHSMFSDGDFAAIHPNNRWLFRYSSNIRAIFTNFWVSHLDIRLAIIRHCFIGTFFIDEVDRRRRTQRFQHYTLTSVWRHNKIATHQQVSCCIFSVKRQSPDVSVTMQCVLVWSS